MNLMNEAKGRFKIAKKDVKDARQKLNLSLEKVINKIENKKKKINETQRNLTNDPESSSPFKFKAIKQIMIMQWSHWN